ncbi:MAG: DUF3833 domain-containing protein [Burkholderiaceae bacterium]|jgi:hypothetical protein|nr:DUF3833 domain-containing protein [Aquabacterium sp.]NUP87468.1 DUF3833 domain-containing protein [Burkholderiaceae bacterium]
MERLKPRASATRHTSPFHPAPPTAALPDSGCHTRRRLLALAPAVLLAACASPQPADYRAEGPPLDLRRYFNGPLQAHGIFTDRSGRVVRRFTVAMVGRWDGDEGVLEEDFRYSDGKTERRVWRLSRTAEGRYTGRADDVVGQAEGEAAGNALRWRYTLALPVDGRIVEVQFDDWMFLVDEQVMLNRAVMSKFGIRLGEVLLSFRKP